MQFLFAILVLVVVLPTCFTAPGTISFVTTQTEVEEIDYKEVSLKVQRNGGSDGIISFLCKILNSTQDDFYVHEVTGDFQNTETSSTCKFLVKDDSKAEGNETMVAELSLLSGSTSSIQGPRYSYIKIIANDDAYGVVGFDVPNAVSVYEPRTAASGGHVERLPLQRTIGAFGSITVHWEVVSPDASSDITPSFGIVIFQNGEANKSLEFSVRADIIIEKDEDFTFELTSVTGGARLNSSLSQVVVRIPANDIPVRFALNQIAVPENQSDVVVWVYRGLDQSGTSQTESLDFTSSMSWYLRSGVAMANLDFHQTNGTLVFSKGETKKSVTIRILEDNVPETAENFTVHLTSLSLDVTLASPSVCTILILPSDDHVGVFKLSGNGTVTISEDGENDSANLTIERAAGSFGRVEVTWRASSVQTGELSKQIQPTNGTVVFNDGVQYQLINISVRHDLEPEEAFSFVVELIGMSGGRLTDDPSGRTVEIKVQDSDDVYGVFEFADDSYQKLTLTSSPRMVHFVVNRNGGMLGTVAIGYQIKYLLPDGSDHTSTMNISSSSGSVSMISGQQNVSVRFTISQKGFIRANAVFRILLTTVNLLEPAKTLLPPQTPRLGARQTLNLTVHPQFADGEIGFEKTSLSVTEPEGVQSKEVNINVFRDGTLYSANLLWSITGMKTSTDVRPTEGRIAFEKGADSANITIHVLPDSIPELDESFTLQLHNISEINQRLQPSSSELVLTILANDNPGGTFQFDSLKSTVLYEETGSQFRVDVIRLGGDLVQRYVTIETTNGEDDFYAEKKILEFEKGKRRRTETFHVKPDDIPEANETFTFRLVPSGPTGKQGRLGNFTEFNVTILANDDANGIIVFRNTSLSIAESKGVQKSVHYFLERQRGLFGLVVVSWNVTSKADSALDISPTFGMVVFMEGERLKTLEIFSRSDNIPEENENFTITLTKAEGGAKVGSPRQATLTILRNDDAIEFAAPTHARIPEGHTVYFTILRKGRHETTVVVNYTTRDGSATSRDRDYEPASQQVSFAIGEVQRRISVFIPDDDKPERDENFTIALTSSTGDTVIYGNTVAVVTIAASDDPNGIFHFDGNSVLNKTVKERETVNFRVIRDRGIFGTVNVLWQIYQILPNGSRVKLTSGDFKQTSGSLVFEDGDKMKDLQLEILSDELAEYEEQFEVVLVNTTGGHPGPGGEISKNFTVAYIKIPTNDHPYGLFAFSPSSLDVSVAEDTRLGFEYKAKVNLTVLRKRGSDRDVGVSWCIYKTDGVANLGDIWDLIFLSRTVGPGVVERPQKRRPNTGSNVLEFTGRNDSYAVVNSLKIVSTKVMTISAWIQPKRDVIGTILAKVTTSSIPYKLVIDTKGNVTLSIEIRSTGPRVMTASTYLSRDILDGSWHNIMVSIDGGTGILFYYDGDQIGTNSSLTFREILDGPGDLYLGASRPNEHPFQGMLQDVKMFTKALRGGEVKVIAKQVSDLKPINGYLAYPQSVSSHIISIETVDNTVTEDEKIFSMILASSRGGADIDDASNSRARLTVLKSDHANGLFEFSSGQTLSKTVAEDVGNISVQVKRTLGFRGQVTVKWEITNENAARATEDFDSTFGQLVFDNGIREKTLTVSVNDDTRPELLERFTLRLVSAQSNDGKKESTPKSGAGINLGSSQCNITIDENDAPYGLLQFSSLPPRNGSIVPLTEVSRLETRESIGVLKLYVVRAQGTLGNIECSWKIVAGIAIAGADYVDSAGTVTFRENETNVSIAITVLDNDKPELNKTFRVQLYGATNGAQIGPGGVAVVTILPSDDAFGVINFTSSSLSKVVREGENVNLELQRTGGTLGPVDVFWEVDEFGDDFVYRSGQVSMDTNQRSAVLSLSVKRDLLPELSESFHLRLINVSNGRLTSHGIVSNITVLANDDPHGVFEFDPVILSVQEADRNVTLIVARQKGTMGKTRVYYTSVSSSVLVKGLIYARANESQDYRSINGFVDFQPNQTSASIVLRIMDDIIPEDNETVVVNLTSVILISDTVIRPAAVGSPRIGAERLGEVVILRNDNASGIIRLSLSAVTVREDNVWPFLSVVRSVGTFGEVKVDIEVTPSSATVNKDYHVNSSTVTIPDGQATAFVPISIINDKDPEFDETFIVRLLSKGPDGSVFVESPTECIVTIEENDYPHGLIGFSDLSLNKIVTEPSSGSQVVTLDVIREYGTVGVVRFTWEVTNYGKLATNDVQQTKGKSLIPPGENKTSFEIVILADNVPEVNEVLLVTLNVTQGKAKLNPDRFQGNVTIQLNDDAHGVVEFSQDSYTVEEGDENTVANVSIVRKRGTYGDVRVYYSTVQGSSSFSAVPNQDYIPVSNASVTVHDGSNVSAISIVIIGDFIPELGKSFNVILGGIELINSDGFSSARIGPLSHANVTIEDDDHVYGLFKVFAIDPKDDRNRSRVVVNETDGLAITFVIQRYGGNLGVVTVEWVISSKSTAGAEDFDGSGSIFRFNHGERRKDFTLTIAGDNIPERDETIIVKLVNPTGGASVPAGTGNNATVVILANDVVAGKIGFDTLSRAVVVKEGQVVVLSVTRTPPAAGTVTTEWTIQGDNVTKDFNETSGLVQFKEGQNLTFIKTLVLADNISEVDELFQVILTNPMTSGVSWTGAAEINDRTRTSTVTIAASNEPHGVLEFQQSSRRVTVREIENVLELSVARLFGNIGTIRVHFTVINGSKQHLGSDERLAAVDKDVDVDNSSITIKNGIGIGIIPINIISDGLAELDEYFLVNITSVELVNPPSPSVNNKTFTPPRLGRYLTSEVKIEANDGPYGILVFSPARVSVSENISVFNLTILRTQGTYHDIEVSYYIRKLNIQENDFHVYGNLERGGENRLKFVDGQRTQNITVFVHDDNSPEGDETFEVHLKDPRGGAQFGKESVANVAILVSDGGNGIFKFDGSSLDKSVDEPGSTNVGTTRARFTVVRENGTIGVVIIGWSVRNDSASMDLRTVNGTVTFKDGEREKSFTIDTIVDSIPEKKEKFLVVLSVLSGGGEVLPPYHAWLTVSENDAPYGEFGFAVSPDILNIEETVGFTELRVIRHRGSYGLATVDYQTTSKTTVSRSGPVMKFGTFQNLRTRNARTWHPFSAYGKQYLLLGSSNDSISDNHGNAPSHTGSALFRWQGIYTHISDFKTNNAVQWESFSVNDQYYIAVANHGTENNHEINSTIYKLYQNGTTVFHQHILTQAASDVKFFQQTGSSSCYLIFANLKNDAGNTVDVLSKIYRWSNGRFVHPGLDLNCRGASGLALFNINNRDMLSISSYYDSVNKNYQSKSVIFEWKNQKFESIQEITTNGATGVQYFKIGNDHFLLFVNSRLSPCLYKWSGTAFLLHQNLPVSNAKAVKEFTMNGKVFLAVTSSYGSSQLLMWNNQESNFQFFSNITDSGAIDVEPITLQDPVVYNVSLLAVAMAGSSARSRFLQPAMVSPEADYIPRCGQLIFEDGDTELSIFVTIINDSVSEPDESFLVSLSNATGGSVVGPGKDLEVNILSNGNPYGRVSFAKESLYVVVVEGRRDSIVYLEVLREQGNYGEVVVAWNSTGNATGSHGDTDVSPTSGEVIFLEGERRKTINLTIFADDIPEVNEVLFVRLTFLKKDGSDVHNKGAGINTAQDMATIVIKSNDEPHGIVGWKRTVVLAQESEAINSTVQLVVERLFGTFGDIEISYKTVEATSNSSSNERPAVPYQDFIPTANRIVMGDGVNITTVYVNVIHDDNAELNEIFFVNLTNVRLLRSHTLLSPRISSSSQTAKVIISENDNKRGELEFNVTHLLDPRTGILRINENIRVLSLQVVRSGGMIGRVGFEYRLVPETLNQNDYFPTKGQIIFLPNVTSHVLEINITDDDEAEVAERFRVEMTQPIGGAKLGNDREVSVEIRASDQPYGVFQFSTPSILPMEEGSEVQLTVARLQGSFREVHVQWNLSIGAFPDVSPANGTLTFDDNVTSQVIILKARDDVIPEGDKVYVCHLVSADNGGVIGSEDSVTLRIDANDDGYGLMAIDRDTSRVFVGEPNLPSYNGEVTISILRNIGAYGEVLVEWEITADLNTFNETRGTVVFGNGVKVRSVTLQVKQDSYPEETQNYTFSLTGTRDARIDQSAFKAIVVVVSSDHPYGIIEFLGTASRNVSEGSGQVTLNVIRHKGHIGRLLVTMNVVTNNAIEGTDFQITPKVLIIEDKQDYGSLNVTIISDVVPELSESFSVSFGNIELITSTPVYYGYKNGLQVDMPPVAGNHSNVVITILKNDDPHGVVEFKERRRVVHEHDGSIVISIIRTGGTFGVIRASYTVTNLTAQYGIDYIITDGTITFGDGEQMTNLTIQLVDDNVPEDKETFRLELTSVDGGARLGERKTVLLVIETSDNPDGLFGFINETRLTFSNPNATQSLKLGISRIGGARSLVDVKIHVFKTFPNNGTVTDDVHPETENLVFPINVFGPKIFELSILPFLEHREVEEHFVVAITEVSGNASIDSLASNVTVIILKHGMPNGLFGFESRSTQTVSESRASPVALTVERREGRKGTVEVKWMVSSPGGADYDFVNNEGTLVFNPGDERKQISLTIVDDNTPELNEEFTVTLLAATGGGDIDRTSSNATITISANDNPHGAFRLRSNTQRITVEDNLSRTLSFTVERTGGKFGEVNVAYSLQYSTGKSNPLKGYVTIGNGEIEETHTVVLDDGAFLFPGSHFTLTLTAVSYQGPGVSEIPPTLVTSGSTENIQVHDHAANSIVKFKDGYDTLVVNQDNQVPSVSVSRRGLYGIVTVFISNGYVENKYSGFTKGLVKPSVSQVTFAGNEVEKEFSVQVTPLLVPNGKFIYAISLSRVSTPSNVRGGSKIDKDGGTAVIEAGGVVVVAMTSQNIVVKENQHVAITVYRLFSSLGTINVIYSTQSNTATPNKDYIEKRSSQFSMIEGEYRKVINIDVRNDEIPELDETFIVNITGVTGANTRLGDNTTSTITIQDDDSPHGILFFVTPSVAVYENSTTVDVVISRSGGTFGNVGVQVRTVGGGESWNAGSEIENVLSQRDKSSIANTVSDYDILDTQVNFLNEAPTPSHGQNQTIQLTIKNDIKPERDEDIYLYMLNPSDGAVLASPSTGKQTWTVVTIKGNDLMNGMIGFETNSLTLDEDKDTKGELTVERSQSLGTAKVNWVALNSNDNLEKSTGTIVFQPNEMSTKLVIQLKNDNEPELETSFTVKLVSLVDTREATIDPTNNVVNVTVLASDDPAGVIAFNQGSRNVAVDESSKTIELDIAREHGTNGRVTVSYKTTMLPEQYTDGGLEINRAIEDKDYSTTQGTLVFKAGQRTSDGKIVITLTPSAPSSSSYPKAFNVTLFNITGGVRLNSQFSTTMVIISNNRRTTQFLKLRSDSLKTPLSNSDIQSVLQSLYTTIINQRPLSVSHISIVTNVMNTILDDIARGPDEMERELTQELSDLFMSIFDILLNPEREDFRGKTQLTTPFVKFAFSLVHGRPCPDDSVVKKSGKFATVEGRRRLRNDINGLILTSSPGRSSFTFPSNMYLDTTPQTSGKCEDVHFIEYLTSHWFNKDNKMDILNDRVLSTSVKNDSQMNPTKDSSIYKIYASERRVTPKGAECLKWISKTGSWDNTICSVKKESDDLVECECRHFSNFAVRAQSDDRIGYQYYFYIAAFICMISFFLVILSHYVCSIENTFSSKLLMHMLFAGFVLQLLVIVTAYITPDLADKPTQCATLGILIHYFLLAHFCWILVQCCNLWRILVLNDERTERKFILYFMIGWGIPLVFVASYIIVVHGLYGWGVTDIYADVHNNGDMCFIRNGYGALASVLGPVLLFLLGVCVVASQAYQVTLQWKLYDDIFRGHHNIKEVIHLWVIFIGITLTWLFGGLHLAYGKLWLVILFSLFELLTGMYVFMVYFVLRNQCRGKYRNQEAYLLNASSPSMLNGSPTDYYAERPVMNDAISLQSLSKSDLRLSPPDGNEWDEVEYDGTTPVVVNPLYDAYHGKKQKEMDDESVDEEKLSQDFSNLIYALKTGETLEDMAKEEPRVELKTPESIRTDKFELRRVSIADTHV